jgi:P2-related tail formation protein
MKQDLFTTSLLDTAPSSIRDDPQVRAACKALDAEFLAASKCIEEVVIIPNIAKIENEALLDILAVQFHVDFWQDIATGGPPTIEKKRQLILKSLEWHTYKGTPWVVRDIAGMLFSDVQLLEWFEYGGNPYFFKLIVGTGTSDPEILRKVIEAVNSVKNARSWMEEFIVAQPTQLDLWHASVTTRDIKTQIFMMLVATESTGPVYVGLSLCIYKIITISAPMD